MLSFLRLVAAIAVMRFLGFAFGATVGERNWLGPWPCAIAGGAVGAWLSVTAFGRDDDDEQGDNPLTTPPDCSTRSR
jgi:hypothetical protein